ncbi:odorant receptor 4-like [Colletes gigas]|uniref:odorant receptor 4-like n=1 Tax=Colletes gigas TaxID=935657 RepID=UPI001C9BA528|nr:odorant receptor 4-like [Colletes gigas]
MHDRSRKQVADCQENFNYEQDINYTLKMCQWVLKTIGMWPLIYNRTSKLEKLVSIGLLITCFSCLLFFLIPFLYYMFSENNGKVKVKLIASVIFCLACTMKYCFLVLQGAGFKRCILHIERDWRTVNNPNHRNIMLRHVNISKNLNILCAAFLYTAGLSYHAIIPLLSKGKAKANSTGKSLAYPVYDPFFDTKSSPTYEIIFCIQFVTGLIRYSITLGAFSLAVLCVTHICGQIQIQISRLENVIRNKKDKHSDRNAFAIIVRDHAEILRFSKNVEETLGQICLTQIVESTLVICCLLYNTLTEWQNRNMIAVSTYSIYLISFTFNIFIFCYTGEILSEQCSQIGPASYGIEWYNLLPKKAYNLVLLNVVSLYPPKLMGGKIIELSLNTFGAVLKTSVVYFNLLRTLADW